MTSNVPRFKNRIHPNCQIDVCIDTAKHMAEEGVCVLPCTWDANREKPKASYYPDGWSVGISLGHAACLEYTLGVLEGRIECPVEVTGVGGFSLHPYVMVLDVEDRSTYDSKKLPPLPITTCVTKSGKKGGYHYWFLKPEGTSREYTKITEDGSQKGRTIVEVFMDKHHIVLPGSIYKFEDGSIGNYSWVNKGKICMLPEALLPIVSPKVKTRKDSKNKTLMLLKALGVSVWNDRGDGKVDVECPFRDEHTDGKQSSTAATVMPNGVFKCMHSHGTDLMHTNNLILKLKEKFGEEKVSMEWDHIKKETMPVLQKRPNTNTDAANESNAAALVRFEFGGRLEASIRHDTDVCLDGEEVTASNYLDRVITPIQSYLSTLSERQVMNAVRVVAPKYDPVGRWLEKNTAEPVEPSWVVENLFQIIPDAPKFQLYVEQLASWLRCAVGRAVVGGTPSRQVLVLKGEQGVGKSTFFESLVKPITKETSKYYWSGMKLPDDGDVDKLRKILLVLRSKWIVEIRELEKMTRYADKGDVKGWLDETSVSFTTPGTLVPVTEPRRFVLGASINVGVAFGDATGNTRYQVIELPQKSMQLMPYDEVQWDSKVAGLWRWAYLDLFRMGIENPLAYRMPQEFEQQAIDNINEYSTTSDLEEVFLSIVNQSVGNVVGVVRGSECLYISRPDLNKRIKEDYWRDKSVSTERMADWLSSRGVPVVQYGAARMFRCCKDNSLFSLIKR